MREKAASLLSKSALLTNSALIQAIAFLLRPASTYEAIELGAPLFALGAVSASFAIAPLLLALPAGQVVDRLGERVVMIFGAAMTLAAGIIFVVWTGSLIGLIVANAVLGVGHLTCIVGQQTVVANSATKVRLDSMFGYYTFAASLGQAIGPLIIAVVGGRDVHPDTHIIFLIATSASCAMFLSTLLIRSTRSRLEPATRTSSAPGLLRTPGVVRALATSSIVVAAVDLTSVYIPALGAELGLSAGLVGIMLALRALLSMASRLVLGRMTTRLGRKRLMTFSIMLSAVSLAVISLPVPTVVFFVAIAILGFGLGVGQPLTMSWLIEKTPAGSRGRALSVRLAGNRFGQLAIPTVLGATAASFGAAGVIGATALVIGSTLIFLRGVSLDESK